MAFLNFIDFNPVTDVALLVANAIDGHRRSLTHVEDQIASLERNLATERERAATLRDAIAKLEAQMPKQAEAA